VKHETIIVRYGEIALKGKETRKRFENILTKNIMDALKSKKIQFKITWEWGRIFVYTEQISKTVKVLEKIFGITSVSPAYITKSNIESISDLAVTISKKHLSKNNSFAIRSSRAGEHKFSSQDVAIKVGQAIVDSTHADVNLSNPDFELSIDVRNDNSYMFTEKIRGPGGMPLGTQGKILANIDKSSSILAAWYLMKRGCFTIFVTKDTSLTNQIESFANKWYIKPTIFEIHEKKSLLNEINHIATENECLAIVTGHILDNNPDDTLLEIKEFKKHFSIPVLHPLITMDPDEINNKKKEIGLKK
jgi:thiamine biosynthesis protein ThiI